MSFRGPDGPEGQRREFRDSPFAFSLLGRPIMTPRSIKNQVDLDQLGVLVVLTLCRVFAVAERLRAVLSPLWRHGLLFSGILQEAIPPGPCHTTTLACSEDRRSDLMLWLEN
jgi:hypothetical protein